MTERVCAIDSFTLPARPTWPCAAWPTTAAARAKAERAIVERVNRKLDDLASGGVWVRPDALMALAEDEMIAHFGERARS